MRARDIPDIDPEVINLVGAINMVPGLRTTGSCSGHGGEPLVVFIECNHPKSLYPVAVNVDRRYSRHGHGPGPTTRGWQLLLVVSDVPQSPIRYMLTSWRECGQRAYKEADMLAERIMDTLNSNFWKTIVASDPALQKLCDG